MAIQWQNDVAMVESFLFLKNGFVWCNVASLRNVVWVRKIYKMNDERQGEGKSKRGVGCKVKGAAGLTGGGVPLLVLLGHRRDGGEARDHNPEQPVCQLLERPARRRGSRALPSAIPPQI